jgi:LuxR family maltose regulon positive regulatory protein
MAWPSTGCLIALGALRSAPGDAHQARALLREARTLVAACPDPGTLPGTLARTAATLRTTVGPSAAPAPSGVLSERELTVLRLLSGSLPRREIAAVLHVSINTVKTQIQAIYHKLGVSTRAEAAARARAAGLL